MRSFLQLFHYYIVRDLARNPIRTGLTITGVALGIAVVVGVQLANDRAIGSFNDSLRILGGGADLQITANGLQLDENLIGDLDWDWDIGALTAIVEGRIDLDDTPNPLVRESIQVFGIDLLSDAQFNGGAANRVPWSAWCRISSWEAWINRTRMGRACISRWPKPATCPCR